MATVFNQIVQVNPFPNETLEIQFNQPNPSVTFNGWFRQSHFYRRNGDLFQYVYDAENTEYFSTSQGYSINTATVPSLSWTPQHTDKVLAIQIRDTDDTGVVNVLPSRFTPELVYLTSTTLSGAVNFCPWTTVISGDQREDKPILWQDTTGCARTEYDIGLGKVQVKRTVRNNSFAQYPFDTTGIAGIFVNPPVSGSVSFQTPINYGGSAFNVSVNTRHSNDPDKLFGELVWNSSEPEPDLGVAYPVSGTIDYESGTWALGYNVGYAPAGKSLSANYVPRIDKSGEVSIVVGPDASYDLTSTGDPLYLYHIEITAASAETVELYPLSAGLSALSGFSDLAYELSWNPSATVSADGTYSPQVQPNMLDLFELTTFDLDATHSKFRLKQVNAYQGLFMENATTTNEVQLNEWVIGGTNINITNTEGGFAAYTFQMDISSTNGRLDDHVFTAYVNSSAGNVTIDQYGVDKTESTYLLKVNAEMPIDPSQCAAWRADPDEHVYFKNCNGVTIVPNQTYQFHELSCVSAFNIGPSNTGLILSSCEFNNEWGYNIVHSLSSSEDYPFGVDISRSDSCSVNNTWSTSAHFTKNDLKYRIPRSADICWRMRSDISNTLSDFLTATNRVGDTVSLPSCVRATNNDKLSLDFDVGSTTTFPYTHRFVLSADYHGLQSNVSSEEKILLVRETPDPSIYNSSFSVNSGTSGYLANSLTRTDMRFLSGDYTFTMTLDDLPVSISAYDIDDVIWNVAGTTFSGTDTVTLSVLSGGIDNPSTSSVCVSVQNIDLAGWDNPQCFSDCMNFHFVGPNPLEYTAFPTHRWQDTELGILSWNNLSSDGLSAYNCNHTETLFLSALSGFDRYLWEIGGITHDTTEHRTNLSVSLPASSYPVTLSVWDYDTDNITPWTVDSLTYTVYDYPTFSNTSTLNKNVFNMNEPKGGLMNINWGFAPASISPANIVGGGTGYMELSSPTLFRSRTMGVHKNNIQRSFEFNTDDGNLFTFPRNTFHTFDVCLSADINVGINRPDYGACHQNTDTTCIPVTVYSGPFLDIGLDRLCVSANEVITFENLTPNFPGLPWGEFTFDDGAGNIMTTSATDIPLSGLYAEAGTYSPSLTSILNGETVTKTFTTFLIANCGSRCVEYDPAINRKFPDDLNFPNTCHNIKFRIKEPLEWTNFNKKIDMVFENIEYLKNMSTIYSLNAPSEYLRSEYHKDLGLIRGYRFAADRHHVITNENKLRIYDKNFNILLETEHITEGEKFESLSDLEVRQDGKTIVALDGNKIYVFDVSDAGDSITMTHFWGGVGDRGSRTGYRGATALTLDTDKNLYVCDSLSYTIKKYNKYHNWTQAIFHADWTGKVVPIDVSVDSDGALYVLTNWRADVVQRIYKFDSDGNFVLKFDIFTEKPARSLLTNPTFTGVVYAITLDEIYKYTVGGVLVNKFDNPPIDEYIAGVSHAGNRIFIIDKNWIHTVFDCLETLTIRDDVVDDVMWTKEQVKVHRNEFTQDWVFKDSLTKICQNIDLLRKSYHSRFVVYLDERDDSFLSHGITDILAHEKSASACSCEPELGINENVSWSVMNREFDGICDCLDNVLGIVESKTARLTCESNVCWLWERLTTNGGAVAANCNTHPYSWIELPELGVTNWNGLSCETAEPTELETINYQLSAASNKVDTEFDSDYC